jgi:hypothetical protein
VQEQYGRKGCRDYPRTAPFTFFMTCWKPSRSGTGSDAMVDRMEKPTGKVRRMDGAQKGRRYKAGDTIKLEIVLRHWANLKEVRLIFVHGHDETMTMIGRGEPYPISDRTTDAAKRSRVDVEITIPRGKTPGVYKLERIGYETAGGELGYLAGGKVLAEASQIFFEVVREPTYRPRLVDIAFARG